MNLNGKESPRKEYFGESPSRPPPERVTFGLYSGGPGVGMYSVISIAGLWLCSKPEPELVPVPGCATTAYLPDQGACSCLRLLPVLCCGCGEISVQL